MGGIGFSLCVKLYFGHNRGAGQLVRSEAGPFFVAASRISGTSTG
jgi:hypothetical protein